MATYESALFTRAAMGTPTDAEFRAWGEACDAAIEGAGLTVVTRNVNWTTATLSGVAGTIGANDNCIYRFNDGLAEIYIKVEWGRGSATAAAQHQYKLQVTIAKDSGFAQASTLMYVTSGSSASAITDWSWHASFGDNCFVLTEDHANMGTNYNPAYLVVERSRDNDGTVNADAVIALMTGNTLGSTGTITANAGSVQRQFVFNPFVALATANAAHGPMASTAATANEDVVVPIVWGYDARLSQMRSIVAIKSGSVSSRQNITVQRSGADKAYRVNALSNASFLGQSSPVGTRCLYRWE